MNRRKIKKYKLPYSSKQYKKWLDQAYKDIEWASGVNPVLKSGYTTSYSTTGNSSVTIIRRITWLDVWTNYGIVKIALKDLLRKSWNLLIIMKDFLLIKSRSFSENLTSTTGSFLSGCTDKPALSYTVLMNPAKFGKSEEYTNTTFSGGLATKRKAHPWCGTRAKHKHRCFKNS